jgi:subtilisin family serine protease
MTRDGHRPARILPLAVLALLGAGFAAVAPGVPAAASPARDKIDPWVLERAVGGTPTEFIVVLAEQADLSPAAQLPDRAAKGRFVRDALYAKAQASQAPLLAWLDAQGVAYHAYYIVNAVLVTGPLAVAEALAARADVARIEGNPELPQVQPVELTPEELDAAARSVLAPEAIEPGVTSIRAPEVWALGHTGEGIVIGGADTGVKWDHPALQAKYRGWDGSTADHDYNWHDSVHSGTGPCGFDSPVPCDDHGHGTHTVGTAVGADWGGVNQIGVAPGARFIACRNMDQGNGTPARYLECMEWFLAPYPVGGTPAQGDPSKAPDLTTNSWGCPASEGCVPATLQAGVEAQRAAGIMFVAAAGNSGSSCSTVNEPPSHYDASYTVGAYSASTGTIASFSSRGPVTVDGSNRLKPDISAPGVSVRSAVLGDAYGSMSGTSMATPHVAGAIALLWSAHPELRNDIPRTEEVLNQTAVDVSSTSCSSAGVPNNVYGWGRLDIKAAVDLGPLAVDPPGPIGPAAAGLSLAPAQPNPAHRSTLLRLSLAREGDVDLAVFSSSGRRVRTLMQGARPAGEHAARWDGLDGRGQAVPPGLYLVRLRSRDGVAGRKLIWLGP